MINKRAGQTVRAVVNHLSGPGVAGAVFWLGLLSPQPAGATAPIIIAQPVGAVVGAGQPASLTVTPSGTAPFGYQWLKDGVILPGQTYATLTYASFQFTNSGSYYVVITNSFGMAISIPASLSVSNAPLKAWGYNGSGQLGNGNTTSTNLPITATNNVVACAAVNGHSLCV